jgi:predicted 2-oxoglutarate/Fe(II)-dependent dioxygenase YbiX
MENNTNNGHSDLVSITPSGFFGDGSEMIGSIENFLTDEELTALNSFIRGNEEWDKTETHHNEDGTVIYDSGYWDGRVATYPSIMKTSPETVDVIRSIVKRLKIEIDNFFDVNASPTSPALVRWLPGNFQMPHADKELHIGDDAGKPNDFPWYDIATIIYLNDDYEGGELYFPNQEIQFKPKRGGAYFFPGDMNYIHGITEITGGIRYTCPFFWTILSHNNLGETND